MTLIYGECLAEMAKLEPRSVDMVLCDLPYGTTRNRWDSRIDLERLWHEYGRLCTGAVVLTATQPFTSALVMSNPKGFRYHWIWEKPAGSNPLNAKRQPLRCHEEVLVFGSAAIYNAQMGKGRPYAGAVWTGATSSNLGAHRSQHRDNPEGTRYPRSVVRFPQVRNGVHPTQKPVALMEYLIRTYTNPGMTVLDNCMGSGTTGDACMQTGRQFIGIESDEGYFRMAQQRIRGAADAN